MRKRYRVLLFAALVAALIVPVGYALSIDSSTRGANHKRYAVIPTASTVVAAPIMMPRTGDDGASPATTLSPLAGAAKLACIGTVLFGLAAALRKNV
jgi:hypothetical protein